MRPPPRIRRLTWRSQEFRGVVYQVLALLLLAAAVGYLLHNTLQNMRGRGIQSGFGFFLETAGFSIGETLLPFDSSESYAKAYAVGLSNTLRVAIVGIVGATLLGTLVGIGRLSRNVLVKGLCGAFVELFRNVPLLLQLFIWYFVLTELLPAVDAALHPLPGLWLSKNGLQFPVPLWAPGHWGTLAGLVLGALGVWAWARTARARFHATGRRLPVLMPGLALLVAAALLGWVAGGMPSGLDMPEKTAITVVDGGAVTPEYLTVLLGLVIYTAAYIAEIVRAGIQSVPYGQHEASAALGLSRTQELRLVQLPQALRVIIPPLTSQYLNLTKNSSLAVAVGYPDLISIAATALNQTGRALECIAVMMACYLTLSLLTSLFMNFYNRRVRIKER
ncbi:MAG: amino acid ABC transporter permease [Rubrivivax sp. SCN 71-131]|jgi:general L-amino acid transport system permease protein|nr:MAG: amino acid ABC transporter permease [Rubrivivax sp. SCN 71-131]